MRTGSRPVASISVWVLKLTSCPCTPPAALLQVSHATLQVPHVLILLQLPFYMYLMLLYRYLVSLKKLVGGSRFTRNTRGTIMVKKISHEAWLVIQCCCAPSSPPSPTSPHRDTHYCKVLALTLGMRPRQLSFFSLFFSFFFPVKSCPRKLLGT